MISLTFKSRTEVIPFNLYQTKDSCLLYLLGSGCPWLLGESSLLIQAFTWGKLILASFLLASWTSKENWSASSFIWTQSDILSTLLDHAHRGQHKPLDVACTSQDAKRLRIFLNLFLFWSIIDLHCISFWCRAKWLSYTIGIHRQIHSFFYSLPLWFIFVRHQI